MKRTRIILYLCGIVLLQTTFRGEMQAQSDYRQTTENLHPGTAVDVSKMDAKSVSRLFRCDTLSDALFRFMQAHSYRKGAPISRQDLRYLRVLHHDGHGKVRVGEIVCHRTLAEDLRQIFQELYQMEYPIERIRLVDYYEADDETSMQANNTSCFNHRPATGRSVTLSMHAYGRAIDINPFYNPYCKQRKDGSWRVSPKGAEKYRNRSIANPYKIAYNDPLHKLFLKHGFKWGGSWKSCKDYQHFEK